MGENRDVYICTDCVSLCVEVLADVAQADGKE
jgi:hypothetical protein